MSKYCLSDIADFISEKVDFSSIELEEYISTDNMLPDFNGITLSSVEPSLNKCTKFKANDTLFSNIRTYFKKVWFADFDGSCSPDVIVMRTKNEELVLPEFLYLLICSEDFINFTVISSNGAKMPRGDKKAMLKYEFEIPSIEEQKIAINHYFKIKEKIQLNTQINQTLEQISQALFKSWFVDFDPVRAKVQALSDGLSLEQAELAAMQAISGKTPEELTALSQTQPDRYAELAETAKAFPCEMVEVDGVEVPKGWTFQYLKDICNIVYGKGLPKTKLTNTGYRVFGANGVIGYYSEFMYKNPQILIGCRGTVGQVTVSTPFSFITNNSLIIEYENSLINRYYLEHYLRTLNLKEISSGSVQLQITIQNMSGVKLLTPNRETLSLYEINVKDIYETMYQNQIENEKLTKVRDLLLPKLLSGEI